MVESKMEKVVAVFALLLYWAVLLLSCFIGRE